MIKGLRGSKMQNVVHRLSVYIDTYIKENNLKAKHNIISIVLTMWMKPVSDTAHFIAV